jgi:transposase-like protein
MTVTKREKAHERCDPAASVIAKFGGVRALARELGIDASSLSRWQSRRKTVHGPGSGGLIPAKYHWALLALAHERGIALTAEDLIKPNGVS